jgi:hypothetical protein
MMKEMQLPDTGACLDEKNCPSPGEILPEIPVPAEAANLPVLSHLLGVRPGGY